jgi:hypothetical protein
MDGLNALSHIVGLNRQLSVTAIYQNGQFNPIGTAKIDEGIHGRADSATGEQNIVNEDDLFTIQREWQFRFLHDRLVGYSCPIVSVEVDVQIAPGNIGTLNGKDFFSYPICQKHPPRPNPNEHEILRPSVFFQDLMGHSGQDPVDVRASQDHLFRGHSNELPENSFESLYVADCSPGLPSGPDFRAPQALGHR